MRVIFIALMNFKSGSGTYSLNLINSLAQNMEITLITGKKNMKYKEKINDSVKVKFLNSHRKRNPMNIVEIFKIVKTIRKYKPDIIHIQNGSEWMFMGYPFLKNFPILTTMHDPIAHTGENTWRYKFLYWFTRHYSKAFIVHGKKLKEEMSRKYNLDPERIFVTRIGRYEHYFKHKSNVTEEKNSILFQGRISKYKGIETLIKAEPYISKKIPKLKIIIAGRGDLKDYERLIENKDRFQIINRWIDDIEMMELFQKSSIIVLPYNDATQSAVIPIAYECKKPVIATDVGALPEVVENGKTGYRAVIRRQLAYLP